MFNVKSWIILQKKINIHEEYILFQWNVISYVNTVTSHIATTPLTHRPLVDFTQVIFKLILVSDGWGISYHFSKENSKHILQLNHKTDYHNVCSKNCKSQKNNLAKHYWISQKVELHTKIGVVTGASSLCLHKKILNNDETTLLRDNKYRLPNDGQLISTKTSYRDKV